MLKNIGLLVLSLVVSVFSNENISKEQKNHCPYGSSEIHSNASIIGLSCINLICVNETQFCRGSVICDSSYGISCKLFEGLLCQTEGITSSSFKVCRLIPLKTSTESESPEVIESPSGGKIPSRIGLLGVKSRDLSSKLDEGRVNTFGKF
jgi:hypothetical protein